MDGFLLLLAGVVVGTYFAEPIREKVPLLDPVAKDEGVKVV